VSYFANFFTNLKQWEESIGDVEPFIGLKFRKKIQKMLRVMAKKYLSRKTELSQVTNWQNIWMFKVLSVLKYTYCNFYKLTKNYTPALHDKGFHILYCIKKKGLGKSLDKKERKTEISTWIYVSVSVKSLFISGYRRDREKGKERRER